MAELCGYAKIWPVFIALNDVEGFSLWGEGDAGEDRFLADEGQQGAISVYVSLQGLAERIESGQVKPFCDRDAFQQFRSAFRPALDELPGEETVAEFDFVAAQSWISSGLARDSSRAGAIIDCLDASLDLARQFGDDRIISLLNEPTGPLRELFDYLWGDRDEIFTPAAVSAFHDLLTWWQAKIRRF